MALPAPCHPTCSMIHNFRLGDYEADQFSDTRVQAPLARFQQAIEDIETDIIDE